MELKRWILAALLAVSVAGVGTSAWAGLEQPPEQRIALKALRGLDNTVLGLVAEWPKTMYYQSKAHGVPYGVTIGFVQGLAVGVARTAVGVYELATFPIPVPSDYQPILSPQFSFEPEETRLAR